MARGSDDCPSNENIGELQATKKENISISSADGLSFHNFTSLALV